MGKFQLHRLSDVLLLYPDVRFSLSDIKATCSLCLIQASSPLQVKYADGELERLGQIYFHYCVACFPYDGSVNKGGARSLSL